MKGHPLKSWSSLITHFLSCISPCLPCGTGMIGIDAKEEMWLKISGMCLYEWSKQLHSKIVHRVRKSQVPEGWRPGVSRHFQFLCPAILKYSERLISICLEVFVAGRYCAAHTDTKDFLTCLGHTICVTKMMRLNTLEWELPGYLDDEHRSAE